jgi:hypothetical protein
MEFTPGNETRDCKYTNIRALKALVTDDNKPIAAKSVGQGMVKVKMSAGDCDYYVSHGPKLSAWLSKSFRIYV